MMMFRLPSPLPIDWGRFELGPPVGEGAAELGTLGWPPVVEATGVAVGVGAVVAPPLVQAPTSRPTVASRVNPVRCFIPSPPPGRSTLSAVDRQAVNALPDESGRAALRGEGLHGRGDQV